LRVSVVFITLIFLSNEAVAGGGWVRKQNSYYLKASATWLTTDQFYTADGKKLSTAKFSTWSLDTYAEYGITDKLDAIIQFPFLKQSSFTTTTRASGIGDLSVELKYGVKTNEWPVAFGLAIGVPTGDENASASVKGTSGAVVYLPTGDGEWNYRLAIYSSHAFDAIPAYVSFDAGYNIRTEGFADDYTLGLQAGYKIRPDFGVQGIIKRLALVRDDGDRSVATRVGIGEGVQYTSLGAGIFYEFASGYTLAFDYFTAVGKITNIYSGANMVFGISFER